MTIATIENRQPLAEQIEYAERLSGAGLLPDTFKRRPADVLVAIDIAHTLHESPWTVMSEMSVIGGKPSFSAKFMRSRVRQAGHKLRETYRDGVARCVIIRHDDPEFEHVAEWDEAKARQHGYWGKGHWMKNPELMLANRALSECVRQACYEVMGGVGYTPDEVQDFAPEKATTVTVHQAPVVAPSASFEDAMAADTDRDWVREAQECDTADAVTAVWREAKAAGVDAVTLANVVSVGRLLRDAERQPVTEALAETVDAETGEVYDAEVVES